MTENITAPEAAKRLGVGVTTLKTWAEKIGIGHKTGSGVWLYSEKDVSALEVVHALRDEDRSFDTIIRKLGDSGTSRPVQPSPDGNGRQRAVSTETSGHQPAAPDDTDGRHPLVDVEALTERITATVTAAVTSTIRTDNELAEKYAKAAHRIGELESEVRHLTDDRQRLLTTGQDQGAEVERLRAELADQSRMTADLAAELRAERAKPWWRRLLG